MKIHIWNAYASNNSGSYTIVGTFPSEAEAAQVAAELLPILHEHSRWMESDEPPPSPLSQLVRKVGIDWETSSQHDDWPRYGGKDAPEVVALGTQVIIHHDYTVTLPEVFGHYFYRRGGSVDHRLEHTHGPLCAVFEVWWSWDDESRLRKAAECAAICAELADEKSPWREHLSERIAPAWRANLQGSEHPLLIGAAFSDLVAGCEAVRQILAPYPCHFRVQIFEQWPGQNDPLAFLR